MRALPQADPRYNDQGHGLANNRLVFVSIEVLDFATYAREIFPKQKLFLTPKLIMVISGGTIFNFKHPDEELLYKRYVRYHQEYTRTGKIRALTKEYYDYAGLRVDDYLIGPNLPPKSEPSLKVQ